MKWWGFQTKRVQPPPTVYPFHFLMSQPWWCCLARRWHWHGVTKKWNKLITSKIIINSITSSRMARQPVEADKVVQWCVYPTQNTNEGRNQLLSGSLVVHKTSTMKNDHNSFLSYFSREEPESIGLRFTYIATSILHNGQWSIGSQREIPRGRYSMGKWLTRPIPISNSYYFLSVSSRTLFPPIHSIVKTNYHAE